MDIYLGLGSNMGDRRANLAAALAALGETGVALRRISPTVESPALLPDGAPPDWNQPYTNLVVHAQTSASPLELLARLKEIERRLGREDRGRWAPREIDIDILLWGGERISTESLRVPHSGMHERAFVLAPLAALAPRLVIPGFGTRTVLDLLAALPQQLPLWMGIVNVTPDSFSDGGELGSLEQIEEHAEALLAAGAQIIDIGAESTRPGAEPLTADAEWRRLEPALAAVVERHRGAWLRPQISVDTYHPATARRALALGADAINDVSGLMSREMIEIAGASGTDWVAMHHLTVPADRAKTLPADSDPVAEVERWLEARLEEWQRAGLDLERIVFDPGIGFGKNPLQSLKLLQNIHRFRRYGLRCLVGHSRKSFMHGFTDAAGRDLFTLGASIALAAQGVHVLRVHDVAAHAAAYRGFSHVHGRASA